MRIAQVAPLFEAVPPRLYGGTERVVANLTEALVADGHEVTLFASGDSSTTARLVPQAPRALRLGEGVVDQFAPHVLMVEDVLKRARDFDVVHFHIDYLHFPVMRRVNVPYVTTLHGRLDIPELGPLYREYDDVPLVSITDAQRAPIPWVNWEATVYHGLPAERYAWSREGGEYLAFVGRMSPEKGVEDAIMIAERVGLPLRIAGKVDPADRAYFERVVKPLLAQPHVTYVGEVDDEEKLALVRDARALLFPIRWPEPFGLVMIEAMACGTPVIAYRYGSVPEVVDHGVTGFIVDGPDEAVDAVAWARKLDRAGVRAHFETRFSATRMARDYVSVYERLVSTRRVVPAPRPTMEPPAPRPPVRRVNGDGVTAAATATTVERPGKVRLADDTRERLR